jgi:arylsulfatase A-like enzyme
MNTVGPNSTRHVRAPDVLVIVMDCVRASDFPGGAEPVVMPFVEHLRRQSVSFPNAVSVAPWTLPSHASLFTGLYPWEHGCHGKASLTLDPRFPRLAETLRGAGYRSLSLSANPIISPFYRLVDGFDLAEWGEWWEQVQRLKSKPSHLYDAAVGGHAPEVPVLSRRDRAGRMVKTILTRVPSVLSLGDSVLRHSLDPARHWVGNMNPWIEPELSSWLSRQPTDQPTFCFVNLLDAHEPYILDPMAATSWGEWWRHMRIPQDVLALLAGPHPPSREDLRRLHDLYRKAIGDLDARIARIVEAYRQAGRWDRTLLLLTSDHGQAFGEHGMIWHGVRTDEEMLRVPLILRLPDDEFAGSTAKGWSSPLDTVPTVIEAAGISPAGPVSGLSLRVVIDAERPRPLLSAGDGTEWNQPFMEKLTPRRRSELNLFSIAAYLGTTKLVVDATTNAVRAYDLSSGQLMELAESELERDELRDMVQQAREAADALINSTVASTSHEVDERLRSWGYG